MHGREHSAWWMKFENFSIRTASTYEGSQAGCSDLSTNARCDAMLSSSRIYA
jgi:hypothetical protein